MADAYGVIVFGKSKDCVVNMEKLCSELNNFQWSNDGQQWEEAEGRVWFGNAQYPTVFPAAPVSITVEDDIGNERIVAIKDATEEEYEEAVDMTNEEIGLEKLSAALAKYLSAGWIEFCAISNEKLRYADYQSLRVYANGDAKRKYLKTSIYDTVGVDMVEFYNATNYKTTSNDRN